jgi:threonine/homoserine/homoserine lactone efflux protein
MDPVHALMAFSVAAGLLTLTPGLDTALVLRTALVEGPRPALMAGLGICLGCLAWGIAASVGLGAVLALSRLAYEILRYAGAAYLIWMGFGMVRTAFRGQPPAVLPPEEAAAIAGRHWLRRGFTTNLLNPKVGVFYVTFLPQFLPAGDFSNSYVIAFSLLLAGIHALMGIGWFIALTLAAQPFARLLRHPAVSRVMDAVTGTVLLGFGLRLALERSTRG